MAQSHFWSGLRTVSKAVSQVFNGSAPITAPGREATPLQRAIATGSTTNYPISNPWEELAHMGSWSFTAIDAIATQWANSSVTMLSKQKQVNKSAAHDEDDQQKTPIHSHPMLDLLEKPNPIFWRETFFYQLATHYCLTGGFVIWEVRNGDGKPCELWALPRAWLTYTAGTEQFPMGLWKVTNPRGLGSYGTLSRLAGGFWIDVRDTIILNRPHPLYPGEPLGTMTACSQIIDISEKSDVAVWSSLMEAPKPGMIILLDGQTLMTKEQIDLMVEQVRANKGGVTNTGKVMAVQGVKIDRMGSSLNDIDAVNIRKQNQEMVQAAHSVPPIATGIRTETGSYAADAATINTWIELHIQPQLNFLSGCLNHRFERHWPNETLEISAKRQDDPLLQKDRADAIKDAVSKGGASWNEWRAAMKLKPLPGLDEVKEPPPVTPGQQPGMPGEQQPGAEQPQGEDEFDLGLDLPDEQPTDPPQLTNRIKQPMPSLNGVH